MAAQRQADPSDSDTLPSRATQLRSVELARLRAARDCGYLLNLFWQAQPKRPDTDLSATRSTEGLASQREATKLVDTERFTIERPIGAGGMGIVYRAYDHVRKERVAIKTMHRPDPKAIHDLKAEFRTVSELRHRNLVALHGLFFDHNQWFFSMELVEGVPFTDYFRGLQSEALLRDGLLQLADGLGTLHDGGWLHRDIKPSNVVVTDRGRVVILDFGLRTAVRAGKHGKQRAAGTWSYMAPEQAAGRALFPESDLYSVGVMLYEILTGAVPQWGDTIEMLCAKQLAPPTPPHHLIPTVSRELSRLCVDLLRIDPLQRPRLDGLRQTLRLRLPRRADDVMRSIESRQFVGRQAEIDHLDTLIAEAQSGKPTCVLLRGHSGFGKTSLVQEFVRRTWQPHTLLLQGRCYQSEAVPYKAWDELIEDLGDQIASAGQYQELVNTISDTDWSALVRLFPTLQRARTATSRSNGRDVEPAAERRHAFRVLRQLLTALSQRATLVLFIDDLHWGDSDSAHLLAELLDATDGPKLLFIGTYRTEEERTSPFFQTLHDAQRSAPGGGAPAIDFVTLEIGPLPSDEAGVLARSILGHAPQWRQRIPQVLRESQGDPWLVVTISQELRRSQGEGLRGSCDQLLTHRINGLPLGAKKILQTLCLAAQPLHETVAYRAADVAREHDAAFSELRHAQLVRHTWYAGQVRVTPFHDRIRKVCGAALVAEQTMPIHKRLADLLVEDTSSDPEAIASHYRQAQVWHRAAHYYEIAGDRALGVYAFERAARCYREALTLGQHSTNTEVRLRERRADALAQGGRGADAATEYQKAAELAPEPANARLFRRRAAYQLCISGHIAEGKAEFARVLRPMRLGLHASRWKLLVHLMAERMRLKLRGMSFSDSASPSIRDEQIEQIDVTWEVAQGMTMIDTLQGSYFLSRSLRLALDTGRPYEIARACCWQATHVSTTGVRSATEVTRLLHIGQTLAAQLRDDYLNALLLLSEGISRYFLGAWTDAARLCEEAAQQFEARCRGVAWEMTTARAFLLWSLFFKGDIQHMSQRYPTFMNDAKQRG